MGKGIPGSHAGDTQAGMSPGNLYPLSAWALSASNRKRPSSVADLLLPFLPHTLHFRVSGFSAPTSSAPHVTNIQGNEEATRYFRSSQSLTVARISKKTLETRLFPDWLMDGLLCYQSSRLFSNPFLPSMARCVLGRPVN